MKALQFTSPGAFAINDIDVPSIADDEVLLASRAVGICHSDIELLEGRYIIPFGYPIIPGMSGRRRSSRSGRRSAA